MRNLIFLIFIAVGLAGCASTPGTESQGVVSTVKSWVPSFWDDNQSAKAVDMVLLAHRIDCASPDVSVQVQHLRDSIDWFVFYSRAKGWQQSDVVRVVEPISETLAGFEARIAKGKFSPAYCEIKLSLLQQQTQRAATAILGRY